MKAEHFEVNLILTEASIVQTHSTLPGKLSIGEKEKGVNISIESRNELIRAETEK
ncbi:hypothetical protein BgiMline_012264, partial [Biomphalaria glabrata]